MAATVHKGMPIEIGSDFTGAGPSPPAASTTLCHKRYNKPMDPTGGPLIVSLSEPRFDP